MIDILIPEQYVGFDLYQPVGAHNIGGGTSIKYARCAEASQKHWGGRRIGHVDQIENDIVLIEPQWFTFQIHRWTDAIKELMLHPAKTKILCNTDFAIFRYPKELTHTLLFGARNLPPVTAITHPNLYMKHLLTTVGIDDSFHLCDPIPEYIFYPAQKKKRIVCAAQVGWYKRSEAVAALYEELKDSDVETVYIGSKDMWGNARPYANDNELQEKIENATETYLGNLSTVEGAQHVNAATFVLHAGYQDNTHQAGQEGLMAGAVGFSFTHPLNRERNFRMFDDVKPLAEAIRAYDMGKFQEDSEKSREFALSHYSYPHWQSQFGDLLAHCRGIA